MLEVITKQADFYDLRVEDHSWDYQGEATKRYTHGLHSYPAMMIPQVASRLITQYSEEGDIVLDPFCGSGSALIEAKITKRHSIGIDLNPLAILIAKVKTTPINPSVLYKEYYRLIERIHNMSDNQIALPHFFNIDFWFKEGVIKCLAKIKTAIDEICDAEARAFFRVAFSEAIRLSSNSRAHEFKLFRYSQEKLENYYPNAFRVFKERAEMNIQRMEEFYKACPANIWCKIIQGDSTQSIGVIEPGTVDIIVTSPPYGDSRTTVAYGQFSRLSSQWLGLMPNKATDIDKEMLGGTLSQHKDANLPSPTLNEAINLVAERHEKRAKQILAFYADLSKCLKNMARYLRTGGYACIVVGNRRVTGIQLPTDMVICELSQPFSLHPQQIIVRNIPSKSMPLRNSPSNIRGIVEDTMHKEYIVILKKLEPTNNLIE
ncbi:MAG: DNA methyltransferase [Chloroflexota bacterium]